MVFDLFEVVSIVNAAIKRLYGWLAANVEGLSVEREDRDAYAYHIALG